MKYRLADDCLGVSHAGTQIDPGTDGMLDLDDAAAAALAPHGVSVVKADLSEDGGPKGSGRRQTRPDPR